MSIKTHTKRIRKLFPKIKFTAKVLSDGNIEITVRESPLYFPFNNALHRKYGFCYFDSSMCLGDSPVDTVWRTFREEVHKEIASGMTDVFIYIGTPKAPFEVTK